MGVRSLRAPAFNGCSPPIRPEPKWAGPIPTPTSHNYRAVVLGRPGYSRFVRRRGSQWRKPHDGKGEQRVEDTNGPEEVAELAGRDRVRGGARSKQPEGREEVVGGAAEDG